MEADKIEKMDLSEAEREGLAWVKAESSTHNGACVEIASISDMIAMRDSKNPNGPILVYTPAEFMTFLDRARNGDFDGLAR